MKFSLFKKLKATFDHMTGRYHCFLAEGHDLERCHVLRRRVYEKGNPPDVIEKNFIHDAFDRKSIVVACRDVRGGEISGCLRLTVAREYLHSSDFDFYHLGFFPPELLNRVIVISRIAILNEEHNEPVRMALFQWFYEWSLRENRSSILTMVCDPIISPIYRKMGFHPLHRVFAGKEGGYFVPLFLVCHDYENLRQCDSPLLDIADDLRRPFVIDGLEWMHQLAKKHVYVDTGFHFVSERDHDLRSLLTEGLSELGRREILKNAVRVTCRAKEIIITKGAKSRSVGIVIKGSLEVLDAGKVLAVLGEGDLFGEISFVLGVPRTADVMASTDGTEVILLEFSDIDSLSYEQDQKLIWKNMARLLASRLAKRNEMHT